MSWKTIVLLVVVWRLGLFAVAAIGSPLLSYEPSFPYSETLLKPHGPAWLTGFANFDGVHYLTIAMSGYSAQFTQAFFPLFPYLLSFAGETPASIIPLGILLSTLAFAGSLYLISRLVTTLTNIETAKKTVWLLLVFPTSFFFGSLYNESLFLFFASLSIWCVYRRHYSLAGIVLALATATRLVGVFLVPLAWWLAYRQEKIKSGSVVSAISETLPIALGLSGLGIYMMYLDQHFSDPFAFASVQSAFGAGRTTDKLVLIYQVIWRYIKMLLTVSFPSWLYFTVVQEFVLSLIFGGTLVVLALSKHRDYLLFCLGAYLLPTLTGTFSSMPRYVLVLIPCMVVLASLPARWYRLVIMVSLGILIVNTILFTQGRWVG